MALGKTCAGIPYGCPPIDLVELPRLKLAFTGRVDHEGKYKLYSIDHVDLFISNERNALTSKMLAGIPHSILLSNVRGETQVKRFPYHQYVSNYSLTKGTGSCDSSYSASDYGGFVLYLHCA